MVYEMLFHLLDVSRGWLAASTAYPPTGGVGSRGIGVCVRRLWAGKYKYNNVAACVSGLGHIRRNTDTMS
jgi:hypothetical protein